MRQVVHVEAMLIETILEHALRIRVKAQSHSRSVDPKLLVLGPGKANININNLVTADIQSIVDGKEALRLVILPLQVTLCVGFLYNVLGWR